MGYFLIKGGKQMGNKWKQAILQINAGIKRIRRIRRIRRLERVYKYLDNHDVVEIKYRLSKPIVEANHTIIELAKYMK